MLSIFNTNKVVSPICQESTTICHEVQGRETPKTVERMCKVGILRKTAKKGYFADVTTWILQQQALRLVHTDSIFA